MVVGASAEFHIPPACADEDLTYSVQAGIIDRDNAVLERRLFRTGRLAGPGPVQHVRLVRGPGKKAHRLPPLVKRLPA
jgi:hypothetical protein